MLGILRKFKSAPRNGRIPAAAPLPPASDSLKLQTMLYLDATLAVLQREKIPLAQPVHGRPARGARFVELPIRLDRRRIGPLAMRKALGDSTTHAIKAAAGVDRLNVWQQRDALIYQYQLARRFWKFYRRADLPAPQGIGLGVGRSLVPFSLGSRHTLVAGETRSGKSVTLESIIFAVIQSHSPAEVGLVLVDPNRTFGRRKQGLAARTVGDFTNAAHLLRPVACSYDEIAAAIDFVYAEWKRRMQAGIQDGPGVVLVIDELMSEAVIGDRESGNYRAGHLEKLTQLASQGIKNNIFLVVGAQDPRVGNTSGLFMRNLGLRFIGQVTDSAASRALAGRGGVGAHLLTGNGDFVQVEPNALRRFQVAEPGQGDFERLERRPVTAPPVVPVEIISPPPPPEPELNPAILFPEDSEPAPAPECVDACTLAIYFHERQLSVRRARQEYGIIRRVHEAARQYALDLQAEVEALRRGEPPRSPWFQQRLGAGGG